MTTTDYLLNLAAARLGARAVAANDEFFAAKENLVTDAEPIFLPDEYVATGKWMDGWETRRRREPGHDWCVVKLGLRGVIDEVVVDTAHFVGNFPEACSVEVCDAPERVSTAQLAADATGWREVLGRSELRGDSKNRFAVDWDRPVTHLRLRIYPDGGVARLRVHGRALPDWDRLDFGGGLVDLVGVENGGRVIGASDDFFGSGLNLIMPGEAADMRDGWETRRRRGPGHDWIVLALGAPGRIRRVVVDTSHFKGNAPGSCSLEARRGTDEDWKPLLDESPLEPHARAIFASELADLGGVTQVRFNIVPDGGVARLRLWGKSERAEKLAAGLARLNALGEDEARQRLLSCCASEAWAAGVAKARPFSDVTTLMICADRVWRGLGAGDWRQAFAGHPRIGERAGGSDWSKQEQSGVASASDDVRAELARLNQAYEERFDMVFLICATGKSAGEMLAALKERIEHTPEQELEIAAEEQRKITRIRLEKGLTQ